MGRSVALVLAMLAAVLPALGPDSIPEILAILQDESLDPGAAGTELMVRWWAEQDPKGAANWAFLKASPGYKILAVVAAMDTWAGNDPGAAWEYIQAMSAMSGDALDAAQIAMVRGWFDSGKPGLTTFIEKLGMGDTQQRAISTFARKTIQRDGAEAIIAWADSIPGTPENKAFKLAVHRQVASQVALADPAAAADWCDRVCDGEHGSMVRSLIAQRWADQSGLPAMEWVATQPPNQETAFAVQGAFRGWFREDREALMEWVNGFGPDRVEPWFQPALEGLAIYVGKAGDPLEGIRWAEAITDPEARSRTTVTVIRNWRNKDAEAADAWIAEQGFDQETLDRIHWVAEKRRGRSAAEMRAYLEGVADAKKELGEDVDGVEPSADSTDGADAEAAADAADPS